MKEKSLGEQLAAEIERRNIGQAKAATEIGINQSTVSHCARGRDIRVVLVRRAVEGWLPKSRRKKPLKKKAA